MVYSRLAAFFIILFLSFGCFASGYELNGKNALWTSVLSGKTVCEPQKTSSGLVLLNDGRMISCISSGGKVQWEKPAPKNTKKILRLESDYLITFSSDGNACLLNPSGYELWKISLPDSEIVEVFQGFDHRIFIISENYITCCGMNGVIKWSIKNPENPKGLVFLDKDGFLCDFANKRSVSPFGVQIDMKGNLPDILDFKSSYSFADGSYLKLNPSADGLEAFYFGSFGKKPVFSFYNKDFKYSELIYVCPLTRSKCLIFADSKKVEAISVKGEVLWSAQLPEGYNSKYGWSYLSVFPDDKLAMLKNNWEIHGFSVLKTNGSVIPKKKVSYSECYKSNINFTELFSISGKISPSYTGSGAIDYLMNGNYGEEEIKIYQEYFHVLNSYGFSLSNQERNVLNPEKSIYERDSTGFEAIIKNSGRLGIKDSTDVFATLLQRETHPMNLKIILEAVKLFPYDPEDKILNTLLKRITLLPSAEDEIFTALSDAVYCLSLWNCKKSYFSKALEIQHYMMRLQYSNKVHDKVRENLSKLADIKL